MPHSLNLNIDNHSIAIQSHIVQPDFIYFAQENSTGYVKVGGTSNFKQRLSKLHADNALGVKAITTIPCACWQFGEKPVHELLANYRVRGEWFNITPEYAKSFAAEFKTYWSMMVREFYYLFNKAIKEAEMIAKIQQSDEPITEKQAKGLVQSATMGRLKQVTCEQLALYVSIFGSFECVDLPLQFLEQLNISTDPCNYMDGTKFERSPLAESVLDVLRKSGQKPLMQAAMRSFFYLNLHCRPEQSPHPYSAEIIVKGAAEGKVMYKDMDAKHRKTYYMDFAESA